MLQYLLVIFPWAIRRRVLNLFFGFEIHSTARVGVSLISVAKLKMGPGSRIGHLNVIKGLEELTMEESATVGNLNWITAHPKDDKKFFRKYQSRRTRLVLSEHSAVTSRHLIDCTDSIEIGRFATVAGYGSQLLTHSIDLNESEQSCYPIIIGDHNFIGTRTIILPGVSVGNMVVVGAGSVINTSLTIEFGLFAGQPAKFIKKMNEVSYFSRSNGEVV